MPLNPQIPLAAVAGMQQAQPFDPMQTLRQIEQIKAMRGQNDDRDALARLREQQIAASQQKMGLDERQAGIEANNAILKGKQEEAQLWDAVGPYVSFLLKSGARDPETYKEVHPLLAGITTMFPKESAQAMAGLLPTPEQYDPAQTPKVLSRLALFAGMKSKELNEWQTAVQAKQTALGRDMTYDEVMPVVQDLAKAKHVESATAAQGGEPKADLQAFMTAKYGQGPWNAEQILEGKGEFEAKGAAAGKTPTELGELLDLGLMVPSMLSKFGGAYNEAIAAANASSKARTGKPYNGARAQREYQAAMRFVSSLNGPQMVRFMGLAESVINTIDRVTALANEMQLGGITAANAVELEAALRLFGNSDKGQLVAKYLGATNTLKEEFANLVNGGYAPTEDAFRLANKQINENYGVKAMNASLSEVQRLINYRVSAFDTLKPKGVSEENPILEGLGNTTAPAGTNTAPPPRQTTPPPRGGMVTMEVTDAQGNVSRYSVPADKATAAQAAPPPGATVRVIR